MNHIYCSKVSKVVKKHEEQEKFQNKKWLSILNDHKEGIGKIGRVCCIPINQKWRMKSQIVMAFLILFLIIFALQLSITSFNIIKVDEIMQNSQNQLFIAQSIKNLKTVSKKFARLVNVQFKKIQTDTTIFQKIYLLDYNITNQTDNYFTSTYFLVPNQSQFQKQFYYTWVCYYAFGNQTDTQNNYTEDQVFIGTIKRYNQVQPLIQNQNYTYLTSNQLGALSTEQQITYVYPCLSVPSVFRPFNRPWYIGQLGVESSLRQQNKVSSDFHMSQPFQNYVSNITQLALTKSLLDKNYNFKGVIGSAVDIQRFSQLFQISFTLFNALLVNKDGELLISSYFSASVDGVSQGYFFQNETITGFDISDWNQVINLALNKEITHNCSSAFINSASNLLCRWNKINQRNVLIYATHLQVYNYFIVILLDEQQYLEQLFVKRQQIEDDMIHINLINLCSICGLFVFSLSSALLIITIIFKPLNQIATYCKLTNDKNNLKKNNALVSQIHLKDTVKDGVFHPFTSSFCRMVYKFTGLRKIRTSICKHFKEMKYPLRDVMILYDKADHQQQLKDFNENIDDSIKWNRTTKLTNLEKYQLKQISTSSKEIYRSYNQKLQFKNDKYVITELQAQINQEKLLSKEKLIRLIFQIYKKT